MVQTLHTWLEGKLLLDSNFCIDIFVLTCSQHIMTLDIVIESQEDSVRGLINRLLVEQPRHIGVYAPGEVNLISGDRIPGLICGLGDFRGTTYRIVLPNPQSSWTGREYHGMREEVLTESYDQQMVGEILGVLETLVNTIHGLTGVRHIVNPSGGKDEDIRFVWDKDGEAGEAELADWPRRDELIRQGKTVRAEDDLADPSPMIHRDPSLPMYACGPGPYGLNCLWT